MKLAAVLWDMDGTLIDSEPYWHEAEYGLAREHGGYWDEHLAWEGSGTPVDEVARRMIEHGTALDVVAIVDFLKRDVARREREHMPWITGVEQVLRSLIAAGVPSVLVTTSPRGMAEHLIEQAPAGAFAGYICGDDDMAHKPDPAPYLAAGKLVGVAPETMATCVAIEDSITGLTSAAASGATTIAQEGFTAKPSPHGPQWATLMSYEGVNAERLNNYVRSRLTTSGSERL